MKFIFYLIFIHIFFFNTYIAIDIKKINQYIEEYKKFELVTLFNISDDYFSKCNKAGFKQDDEMRLIAIAQAINIKFPEEKAQLPPRFDDQTKEEVDKEAFLYKVKTYNNVAIYNSAKPDRMKIAPDNNDIEIFANNLKKYVEMSPREYKEAKMKILWTSNFEQQSKEFQQKSISIRAAMDVLKRVLHRFFKKESSPPLDPSPLDSIVKDTDDAWKFFNAYKNMSLSALDKEKQFIAKKQNDNFFKPLAANNQQLVRNREALDREYLVQLSILSFLKNEKEYSQSKPSVVQEKKDSEELKTINNETLKKTLSIDKNIKKFAATPGTLLFQLNNEQDILVFSNKPFEQKSSIVIPKEKNNKYTLSDISVYGVDYMYAYSIKNGLKSTSYITSNMRQGTGFYAHESLIKNLFFDHEFVVSHSEENNIRFFDYNNALNKKEVLKKAEYKAKRLISYKKRCLIVEEGVSFFGIPLFNGLYIKYVDNDAKVIAEKKIATYSMGHCFNFLGDIDDQGNAIIYDQCNKSLTAYTNSKDNIITPINYALPEELMKHATPKQIHYLNELKITNNKITVIKKIILVYDDLIYEATIDNNKLLCKKIFSMDGKESKTIFTTTSALTPFSPKQPYQKNIIWIILEDKESSNKKYSIQSILIDKE